MGTHHALQSLGELVGLKYIFAFLMFGPVHHLWAIVNRLFCKRANGASYFILHSKKKKSRSQHVFLRYDNSIYWVTTVKVDSSNQFQVCVDPSDAVHIPTVLESRTDWCLIQVLGFALKPGKRKNEWFFLHQYCLFWIIYSLITSITTDPVCSFGSSGIAQESWLVVPQRTLGWLVFHPQWWSPCPSRFPAPVP